MREILFKARRVDNGEWVEGDLLHSYFKKGDTCICCPDWTNIKRVDPATLCQYTGLTDKNGVKIWEGDVVNFSYICNGELEAETVTVGWVKDDAAFSPLNWVYQCDGCDCGVEMLSIEVIGSAHTTHELMGERTDRAEPLEAGTRRGEK